MSKDFAAGFYNSKAWKDVRKAYLKSVGGLCESCLSQGLYNPGKVVHHVVHLTPENIGDPAIALNWKNLKAVCQDCHAKEHKTESTGRYCFDESGNIVRSL